MIKAIFNILTIAINIYWMACMVNILLTWFPRSSFGNSFRFIGNITNPYLNYFKRFQFLQIGGIDFSPIVSLSLLSALGQLFQRLAYNAFSIKWLISSLVWMLWSPISFLLGFFGIAILIRYFILITNKNSFSTFWQNIDRFLNPIIFKIKHFIFKDKLVNYKTGMLTSAISLIGVKLVVDIALKFLMG